MRLISYLDDGVQTLGVVDPDGLARSVASLGPDLPTTMDALLAGGHSALDRLRAAVERDTGTGRPWRELDLLPPVPRPRNIVCVGRNYREHADEEGVERPERPEMFLKHTSSVVAHGKPITWDPDLATQVDYEAELAVVIGASARRVATEDALSHVIGYTCLNDVSARDLQFGDAQWARGKSLETFCPVGPWMVTYDDVADPQALTVRCLVDGELRQEASSADMYYSVAQIVAYCSQAFTLLPGDIVATGTPGGVGVFRKPPALLRDGQRVVVEIEGIGRLENPCETVR
jgi:2-keto-4-pentenoate hydratase/2-oxohepta-3-ene-1,7-dioic acid hydratase in catechol pathway